MIDFDTAQRLVRMQERLRAAIYHELRQGNGGKSGEGSVNLSFRLPPVTSGDRAPTWAIEVYSYILAPDSLNKFYGATAAEAIGKAEDAVSDWCEVAEMEMFELDYQPRPETQEIKEPF